MAKKKIEVKGLKITFDRINDLDYVSLTDIAKQSPQRASLLIRSWLKNSSTLLFLETWEKLNNPNFKGDQMDAFKISSMENRNIITPKQYIKSTDAIGLVSTPGRYGGTLAHKDIALNFCYWLSPVFQVYMIRKFQELMQEEFSRKNLQWHISKITDNIDEVRNLLDTIPGQLPELNRLNYKTEED